MRYCGTNDRYTFLATNVLSINKGAALHSLIDFQLLFYNDEQSDNEEPASSSCRDLGSNPLSKAHRSTYSTWEIIHALNAVVEATDISKLQHASTFYCCWMNQMTSEMSKTYLYISSS